MLKQVFTRLHRTLILAVLAVALVATGFAHRAPSQTDTALMAVFLAGGSAADICGDATSGSDLGRSDCLACLITAAVDLPAVQGTLGDRDLVLLAQVSTLPGGRVIPWSLDLANTAQGPPTA